MALINISGKSYEIVLENKAGFNMEAFRNRYSEVLERYDFIVGDWGYNQLRLKGFFKDGSSKATKDTTFSFASDYLNEYCNFGCAYFILEKKFDQNEQSDDTTDPLLADLDDDFDLPENYKSNTTKEQSNVVAENLAEELVEVKTVKSSNHYRNQQDKHVQQTKGQDKPSRRRPFKSRQNKRDDKPQLNEQRTSNVNKQYTSTQSVQATDSQKDQGQVKKNKKRPNKPFRHFDRKKNKDKAPINQE